MTEKNLKQARVMEKLERKEISRKGAGKVLDLSNRQIRRKLRRFLEEGYEGLIHRNKGKPSNRSLDSNLKKQIIDLLHSKYEKMPPTFVSEKLLENEKIKVHPETLRRLMREVGLWYKRRKPRSKHRCWRKPKDYFGEMVQLDGSDHEWIDRSGKRWTLVKFIDDATKKILWMEFAKSESWESVVRATIGYFKLHGMPVSLYTDRGKVFKVNKNNDEGEFFMQYERSLGELGVKLIHAYSSQAKDRIERSFCTDQDRLVNELKLVNINTMEKANKFIKEYYIPKMNKKFAVSATKKDNLHRSAGKIDLEGIFCIKSIRKVQNDWTIRYNNRFFQINSHRPAIIKPKDNVIVHQKLDGSIYLTIRANKIDFIEIYESKRYEKEKLIKNINKIYRPPADHPWRIRKACY